MGARGDHVLSAVVALSLACARTEHTPADLQLDILAALPVDAASVRLCATDGPARTFAAADGRYALTGLEDDADITVDVMNASDRVTSRVEVTSFVDGYAEAALVPCDDCEPCIGGAGPTGDLLLAVRFLTP